MHTIKKGFVLTCLILSSVLFLSKTGICQDGAIENYPSLIPLPQHLQWMRDKFYLSTTKAIIIGSKDLLGEAVTLQQIFAGKGINVPIRIGKENMKGLGNPEGVANTNNITGLIVFRKEVTSAESYQIHVDTRQVIITAGTSHGFFNSIQTVKQLIAGKDFIQGCAISDYPVYNWRGYMIDAGRHYYSMALIRQMIDVMASYKLNVFHFHFTDNEAWRLQIKKYPQLTSPAHMLRDKGMYYSIQEVKALITYCRDRHIIFVPEIDMPGHSKAFVNAMGVDMQSDAGLRIMKEIIKEVCNTYDVPYIHIGADEVNIKNEQFIPEITKLIRQYNKQIIAWIPGGRTDDKVIGQWWDGELNREKNGRRQYLDSWYLYTNHFDPESSVANILYRQIGNLFPVDSSFSGGEICSWPDRAINSEQDILWQSPVYPGMVTFSERIWRGGGYKGVFSDIGPDSSSRAMEFYAFEKRLIDHKPLYFRHLPFPYVKQSHIKWKLFGPFPNNGRPEAAFWPESPNLSPDDSAGALTVTGATIWLRHFWPSDVSTWLPNPAENTTFYALTNFKCDKDTTLSFWIGFKDISRSHADAAPPSGKWDYQQSKLWLNGQSVPPPVWANAGKKGDLELPLTDEGFTYRQPVQLAVKTGWNRLLVKLPVGSFKAENGNQYVKWMFTFVPVHKDKEGANWYADDLQFAP
jgi:hexosaminidase